MSTLQNEMIMEDLFDECLCELEQQGYDINKDTTQSVAAYHAQLRFEDMCQKRTGTHIKKKPLDFPRPRVS